MSRSRCGYLFLVMTLSAVLSACTVTGSGRAPVVDAGTSVGQISGGGDASSGEAVYYTVQAGDSLRKIAAQFGQKWQDIAAWNSMTDPNVLKVGQRLLVVPGGAGAQAATNNAGGATAMPVPSGQIEATIPDRMQWSWPAKGEVVGQYNGGTNKGIDIGGKAGDPVYAAADGRVAYVGDGLRGYGKLVIVKHNDVYITAYAHNQNILVQENQVVTRGEQIAEMGDTDAPRVMLHFEVREQGQEGGSPVDPMKHLPRR